MSGAYDAIVIGTGIGGSVAAAILACEGLRVLILEKNRRVGGVCAFYEKGGFRVDVGTHLFCRGGRGPLGRLARRVGAPPIDFVQPRDLVRVEGFGQALYVPRDAHRYPAFVLRAIRELRLGPREVLQATRFFHDVIRFDEARLGAVDRLSMWVFIRRYTDNPKLIGLFGLLLGLYFILPLSEVSAGEGIWCFKRMVRDRQLAYPRGGAVRVPATFLEAAQARGAQLLTGRRVRRIVVEGGVVQGVECADGSAYQAATVVSTASLRDTVDGLVGARHFPEPYLVRVRGLRSSMIAVQAKIALRRPLVRAGCLVGVIGDAIDPEAIDLDDFERLYGDVREGRVTRMTPIYAPVPTNFDPTLAPEGGQLITTCAVAPTTDVELADGPQRWIDNLMACMRAMIPGLDEHLLWVDTWTTEAIGRWSGKLNAPAVSAGQTPDQVGNRRPPVRTPVGGLYVCGCGAGARGVGTELAAASAELAADALVCDRFNGLVAGASRATDARVDAFR